MGKGENAAYQDFFPFFIVLSKDFFLWNVKSPLYNYCKKHDDFRKQCGKGENAGNQNFALSSKCFPLHQRQLA